MSIGKRTLMSDEQIVFDDDGAAIESVVHASLAFTVAQATAFFWVE